MIEILIGLGGAAVLFFVLWVMAVKQSAKDKARAEQAEAIVAMTKKIQKKNLELVSKQEGENSEHEKAIRNRRYFP